MPFESSQHGGQSHGRQKEALEKQQGSQSVQRAILSFYVSVWKKEEVSSLSEDLRKGSLQPHGLWEEELQYLIKEIIMAPLCLAWLRDGPFFLKDGPLARSLT